MSVIKPLDLANEWKGLLNITNVVASINQPDWKVVNPFCILIFNACVSVRRSHMFVFCEQGNTSLE